MIIKIRKTLKMRKIKNRILVLLALFFFGCNDIIHSSINKSMSHNPIKRDSISEVIIDNAILNAGGYLNWELKKTISYNKSIQIYDTLGILVRSVDQNHKFMLKPHLKGKIKWKQGHDLHEIIFRRGEAFMVKNGNILQDENSKNIAWNSFFGSHYVIGMPFKLKDPGALLEYKGIDTLKNKSIVHTIKVTYQKNAGSEGSMHTWYYYFNIKSLELQATFLDHGNGYNYTDYIHFDNIEGVKFNMQRKSYISNKDKTPLFLKTVYTYSQIKYNLPFKEDFFEIDILQNE